MIPLVFALIGCSDLLTIPISDSSEIVVDAGTPLELLIDDLGFGDFRGLEITSRAALANQGVEPGDISSVVFTQLELTAIDPADADLSFLDSIDFLVEADGLDTVLVASQDDFPAGQANVALALEPVDIVEYVVADQMDLVTDVDGRRPSQRTTVRADFTIEVTATVRGALNQARRDDG